MDEPAKLLVVYATEAEKWGEIPLFEAIIRKLCSLGIEGATVHSARMGFGRQRHVRAHSAIGQDETRPVMIVAADSEERLRAAIPILRALAPRNTMLLVDAEVVPNRVREKTAEVTLISDHKELVSGKGAVTR